jgi:hypothetical protein
MNKLKQMNIRILIPALFLLALIPLISTITAQEDIPVIEPSVKLIQNNVLPVYSFVQIVHRDSNGNLLTYTESDDISTIDDNSIIRLMDEETSLGIVDPVYQIGKDKFQVIVRHEITNIEKDRYIADTQLLSKFLDDDGNQIPVIRFVHDGFIALPGDTITYYWNFIRVI